MRKGRKGRGRKLWRKSKVEKEDMKIGKRVCVGKGEVLKRKTEWVYADLVFTDTLHFNYTYLKRLSNM